MDIQLGRVLTLAGQQEEAATAYKLALAPRVTRGSTAWQAFIEGLLTEL